MVASLVYRTTDNTRWGGGQGSDLAAVTIDLNFWTLFSAVQALEDHMDVGAGIDYINQPAGGNLFYVHLTDHRVLGPFVIPMGQWQPRGAWAPSTPYAAYDVVSNAGSVYLITIPHTSGLTFSALATDGLGHLLYNPILIAQNQIPGGGTVGQRLALSSLGTPQWESDFIRLALYVEGQPNPSELLMQFVVTDPMKFPVGLAGSAFYAAPQTNSNVVYTLFKNGAAIGSVNFFGPSPDHISVTFSSIVTFVPGDIITLVAPPIPDAQQANISFTFIATLTL
jgi:hypothetical protein